MLAVNKVMREKSEHLKCGALLLLALAIFFIDWHLPFGIAIGMVYAVSLLLTLWIRDPRCPLRFALLFTVLILMGFLKPFPENIDFNIVVVNRTLSILTVWLCMFFVLTIKRRTGELLERNKEVADYKYALDETSIVAITDAKGIIKYVNDNFCKIAKYSREELVGKDHRIINSGRHPKAFIRALWETIANGRVWHGELCNRAKDGSLYWVDTAIVPFKDEGGKPVQYIAIRADITERKQTEEKIIDLAANLRVRTEALEAANKDLESFSYSVSHDLRAPLRHVHGYVQMLTQALGNNLDPRAQRYLKTISDASSDMGRLIDDLLEFSRMGRTEMQENVVDLNAVVQSTLRALDTAVEGRKINWKTPSLPPVLGDAAMLRQVFANLIGNAVKYSRKRDLAEIEIGIEGAEDGRIVLFVRDNGAGFDMKYAHKLFGVFQRLHRAEEFEGTGIGLATVQRILARHGGRVWAESEPEKGAKFLFTLKPANTDASCNQGESDNEHCSNG